MLLKGDRDFEQMRREENEDRTGIDPFPFI
jgi:hypothetical protein